ncbi:hypothetical protein [Streptomyces sp. ALI-76-A]|uniref:hypothetical protein n=1 Tax=Streptomyces sp. ALI-76-A TaxID=3025736 RepID=UPI00256EE3CC|nr:hypothetical protein [Streptomyces sp. ALI-76-A]MDL5201285.1 hypothetical protein [Streptomyces sp. ALI-76-A]
MRIAHVLVRHEVRMLASLVLWLARRRHGTDGGRAFGYARGQGPVMFGLAFVCLVETVTMSVLLRDWLVPHAVMFFLDVYTIVFVVALHAANVVRPHVLEAGHLRLRRAVHVDLRIPLERITSVCRELRTVDERAEGRLDLGVGAQTSVTLELAEPVAHFTFFGRRRDIRLVRFHADDATELVKALTQARNARSPLPDRPR